MDKSTIEQVHVGGGEKARRLYFCSEFKLLNQFLGEVTVTIPTGRISREHATGRRHFGRRYGMGTVTMSIYYVFGLCTRVYVVITSKCIKQFRAAARDKN